jgi:hypothetical protein
MNERIRELARQARYDSKNEKHYLERVHNREITLDEYQEIYDRKFAELIVRESMDLLEDFTNDIYLGGIEYVVVGASETLQEHFGIEK